ncbi:MAG TPA: stage II sporulation protein M [Candidatus Pacearchaeota archaeon]|nr:stage II sporulation protein M [Candidatus Pacearchaeota archaeon]
MVKKKRGFNISEQYRESWNYIKESRNFIYIIIGVFLFFAVIGSVFPVPEAISKTILEFIEKLLKETQGLSQLELIKYIFVNNLQSSFFGLLLGIIFGIIPVLFAAINGYLLGFVLSISVMGGGLLVIWRLFPHGIFELPAIFISLGLGLRLGCFIFQKNIPKSFRKYFWNSLRVFLFIVLPLLIIAAIIEGSFITLLG